MRRTSAAAACAELSRGAGDRFNRGFERLSDGYARLTRRLVADAEADDGGLCRADRRDRRPVLRSRRPASSRRRTRATSSPSSSFRRGPRSSGPTRSCARSPARILPHRGRQGRGHACRVRRRRPRRIAPNAAAAYIPLKSFEERRKLGVTLRRSIMAEAQKRTADINEARLIIVPPPLIQGIGSAGGYRMIVEDRGGHSYQELVRTVMRADRQGQPDHGPRAGLHLLRHLDAARFRRYRPCTRPSMLGVPPGARVRGAAGLSRLGIHQRLQPARPHLSRHRAGRCARSAATVADIANLKTRSNSGAMVPIGSVTTFQRQDRAVSRDALQSFPGGRDRWRHRPGLFVGPVADDDGEARR